jgi:hypothetical protein
LEALTPRHDQSPEPLLPLVRSSTSIKDTKYNFNCMPIKNYTTAVPANSSIFEMQYALAKYVSTGLLYKYGKGLGV